MFIGAGAFCIFLSKFAKDLSYTNFIQKNCESLYLIIECSDFKSVFSIELQTD